MELSCSHRGSVRRVKRGHARSGGQGGEHSNVDPLRGGLEDRKIGDTLERIPQQQQQQPLRKWCVVLRPLTLLSQTVDSANIIVVILVDIGRGKGGKMGLHGTKSLQGYFFLSPFCITRV